MRLAETKGVGDHGGNVAREISPDEPWCSGMEEKIPRKGKNRRPLSGSPVCNEANYREN
jgi:hypothetical protein